MKVRDRIQKLRDDEFVIKHKLSDVKLMNDDWLCICLIDKDEEGSRSGRWKLLFGYDIKDICMIPNEILDMDYDIEDTWFVGLNASLDLCIKW